MNASTRTLALTALLIAAASATPVRAAIWNGMSANGMGLNGMSLNGLSVNGLSVNGIGQTNGLTSNALTSNALHVNGMAVNALHANGVKPNGVGVNGLGAAPCAVQSPCVQPAPQPAADDSAAPRFQGRSARPLGDVGAAATK